MSIVLSTVCKIIIMMICMCTCRRRVQLQISPLPPPAIIPHRFSNFTYNITTFRIITSPRTFCSTLLCPTAPGPLRVNRNVYFPNKYIRCISKFVSKYDWMVARDIQMKTGGRLPETSPVCTGSLTWCVAVGKALPSEKSGKNQDLSDHTSSSEGWFRAY